MPLYKPAPIPPEKLAELQQLHGDRLLPAFAPSAAHPDLIVHLLRPTREQYKQFRAQQADERTRIDAAEFLARACIAWPARAEIDRLFDDHPGIDQPTAGYLLKAIGFGSEGRVIGALFRGGEG